VTVVSHSRIFLKEGHLTLTGLSKRLALGAITALTTVGLMASVGLADTRSHPDESLEGASFLDIEEIRHRHDGRQLVHTLSTYEPWSADDLDNGSSILFKFNLDRDLAAERVVKVVAEQGEISAAMYNSSGRRIASIAVERPDNSSVEVRFRRSLLMSGLKRYRWRTRTSAHGCDDPNTEINPIANSMRCYDYAPNNDQITHRL